MKYRLLFVYSYFMDVIVLKFYHFVACYPLSPLVIITFFRVIFSILLVWYTYDSTIIYCIPNSDTWADDYFAGSSSRANVQPSTSSPQPPAINFDNKPQLISKSHHVSHELDGTPLTQRPVELDSRPIQPSNLHELEGNNVNSNVVGRQSANANGSLISFYSGQDSSNTSLETDVGSNLHNTEIGSTSDNNQVNPTPRVRFNANDYSNPQLENYLNENVDIGYLAPTPEPTNQYDYTERVIPKATLTGELKLGYKQLKSEIVGVYVKYHDIGKRKGFWKLWEKYKGQYESYEDFKANWDPKTPFLKTIVKEVKEGLKNDVKDAFGVNKGGPKPGGNITSEVNRLLRSNRPFNR